MRILYILHMLFMMIWIIYGHGEIIVIIANFLMKLIVKKIQKELDYPVPKDRKNAHYLEKSPPRLRLLRRTLISLFRLFGSLIVLAEIGVELA